jgi:hypothetical protein
MASMRTILALLALTALAGCGGGSSAPASPPAQGSIAPQGSMATSQFLIAVPARATSSSAAARTPSFVSSATQSVTITLTTVGGNPVTPVSVTANVNAASCAPASPCTIEGPPSPSTQNAQFTITTFDQQNGAGNQLDTNTASITPVTGQANTVAVTLKGIPKSILVTGVPAAFNAGVGSQTATLTVTVKDAAGQTITGTYASAVSVQDHDPNGPPNASSITGTHPLACVNATCVSMTSDTDTLTFNYGGLAEDPVTIQPSAIGVSAPNAPSVTFTPVLHPIAWNAGPTSAAAGNPKGIDLYTSDSTSTVGYTGTESYSEPGFTESPYNKTLTTIAGSSCAAFATLTATDNVGTGRTDFTATSISSPSAGLCTRVVSDGLAAAGHGTGGPSFVVTYTTGGFTSGKLRKP